MFNLNEQRCPFCNENKLLPYSVPAHDAKNETVSIIECQLCQAGWQWPLKRTASESASVFEHAYADHDANSYFDSSRREAVANCQSDFVSKSFGKKGRLLDIGCGDGTFARQMARHGWDVVGLDPALSHPVAEKSLPGRLNMSSAGMADLPPDEFFDVITLWDVIEHVEQPAALIEQAAGLLAAGGILIVETGNYQCAGRIESKGTWWNFQLDHRWYFAPPQLRALLDQAGLKRIELADKVLRPWWTGNHKSTPPSLISLVKSLVKRPWQARSTIQHHNVLSQGHQNWGDWGGLEIMTLIGHKD